jgi:non-specific protein-tyrosine kinase
MSKLKKALERAKVARESDGSSVPASRPTQRGGAMKLPKQLFPNEAKKVPQGAKKGHREVKVTYSRTKVQAVPKKVLERNRIFSLFKDYRVTDEIENLRTQILTKLKEVNGNSILVTSAHPGEGKTFTSINLGVSIAKQLDRTVLIVDTDLRNPWRTHFDFATDFFGVSPEKGLSDYLLGNAAIEDLFINPGIEKLTILPAGKPLPNSSELLGSEKMENLILDLKERYPERVVIFDSPALLAFTDPIVYSHLIDGVLLVVEAERTTPDDIKRAMKLLKDKPLFGTVLNKNKDKISLPDYV